ncbi:MAG: hypothetical protein J3Q66DRAFT_363360 [Benniella sp.]|nr:MAG: hypothetical protein J3Q66DRAFT_363360 [Benniella sp.]
MTVSLSPALSMYSQCSSVSCSPTPLRACHSRTTSESLLFTPPLSPTEEQLLALLIPDIEPAELAAYLSAPTTPILSDVSCLIGENIPAVDESHCPSSSSCDVEAVYPSPVCAAAAATVVALDRLDTDPFTSFASSFVAESEDFNSSMTQSKKKRSSMYAFFGSDDEEDQAEPSDMSLSSPMSSMSASPNGPVYVMSSRNTRKRLMLEQPFVSPDDEDDYSQNCYAQLFHGPTTLLNNMDSTSGLSSSLAFDLVLV